MDHPIDDLAIFSQHALDEQWLAESHYIALDVSVAILRSRQFVETSHHADGPMLVFDVEWRGKGTTLRDLRRDFFAMYGGFGEKTQFIELVEGPTEVAVKIVCGDRAHGHCLVIRLVGQRVARILKETHEAMRSP